MSLLRRLKVPVHDGDVIMNDAARNSKGLGSRGRVAFGPN